MTQFHLCAIKWLDVNERLIKIVNKTIFNFRVQRNPLNNTQYVYQIALLQIECGKPNATCAPKMKCTDIITVRSKT